MNNKNRGLPFSGEEMICVVCDKRRKSSPTVMSGWTMLTVDDKSYYVCPHCFGNDQSSAKESKRRIGAVLDVIARKLKK